jgi:hypothetical protein
MHKILYFAESYPNTPFSYLMFNAFKACVFITKKYPCYIWTVVLFLIPFIETMFSSTSSLAMILWLSMNLIQSIKESGNTHNMVSLRVKRDKR